MYRSSSAGLRCGTYRVRAACLRAPGLEELWVVRMTVLVEELGQVRVAGQMVQVRVRTQSRSVLLWTRARSVLSTATTRPETR
jgi:hypothetical protein